MSLSRFCSDVCSLASASWGRPRDKGRRLPLNDACDECGHIGEKQHKKHGGWVLRSSEGAYWTGQCWDRDAGCAVVYQTDIGAREAASLFEADGIKYAQVGYMEHDKALAEQRGETDFSAWASPDAANPYAAAAYQPEAKRAEPKVVRETHELPHGFCLYAEARRLTGDRGTWKLLMQLDWAVLHDSRFNTVEEDDSGYAREYEADFAWAAERRLPNGDEVGRTIKETVERFRKALGG